MKALLFSGGMDSSAILFWKRPNISFYVDYGQSNSKGELRAVKIISKELKIPFEIIKVNCSKLGKGILSGDRTSTQEVLSEWWPYRNQLLITLAAMKGIQLGVKTLFVGSVKEDKIYKDGRSLFINNINKLIMNQEGSLRVIAPALDYSTTDLINKSKIPLVLLSWAHSCNASNIACGNCPSCKKHQLIMDKLNKYDHHRI